MLTILQKGEADINVFHDSSDQPLKRKEYRCLVSVITPELAPYTMKSLI